VATELYLPTFGSGIAVMVVTGRILTVTTKNLGGFSPKLSLWDVVVGPNHVFVISTARGQEKDHNLRQAFTIVFCILVRSYLCHE
jgi:hypothetical protein